MAYLLNVVYLLLIVAASPWLAFRALAQGKYRDGWAAKFLGRVPRRTGRGRCLWLHAVSVGEVNLLAPILQRWEEQHPDWECVISTTTLTGFQLAQKRYSPRMVFYCPLDFTWAVARAMRRVRPDLLVLTELEIWPNLVHAAARRGAKVAIINARLSDRSLRGYGRVGFVVRPALAAIDLVAAQNEEYAGRFLQLGAAPDSVQVTGSIKFDGACADRSNPTTRRLAELAGISARDIVFLAGSTQAPEESLSLEAFRKLADQHDALRLILVPRHPERFEEVAKLLDQSGVAWQRRSRLENDGADAKARVLLVDAVGELAAWWGTARVAFVGGSLGKRGGQNMIEPAAYGAAVCFGPNTWNFRDVVAQMLAREAAVVVKNGAELQSFVRRCLSDPAYADALGQRAQSLVSNQTGAADRTVELLSDLVVQSTKDANRVDLPQRPRPGRQTDVPLPKRRAS
jgi:3-deoxy-D-manno-octulosonic-acid transferase